jgi:hypothetical protein
MDRARRVSTVAGRPSASYLWRVAGCCGGNRIDAHVRASKVHSSVAIGMAALVLAGGSGSATTRTRAFRVSARVATICTLTSTAEPVGAGPICQPEGSTPAAVQWKPVVTFSRDAASGLVIETVEF